MNIVEIIGYYEFNINQSDNRSMVREYDIVIIGGGILGVSIAYFLSSLYKSRSICIVEQSSKVATHTSGRNTGKIHAPYLYDPIKKTLFAKTAFYGYTMWKEYAGIKDLPFQSDGVIEVSVDQRGIKTLEKYLKWGIENGLDETEIKLFTESEISKIEPELCCTAALCVYRDGSADYAAYTRSLAQDSIDNGVDILVGTKITDIKSDGTRFKLTTNYTGTISAKFVINAAGGNAIDVAHMMGMRTDLTDVHFRGEYWKAPKEYRHLTKMSVYSVPDFPEYPFLDPHWIIRVDHSCEIGPNAVPVFSPYGYDMSTNIKEFVPKILEMLGSGARRVILDKQFQELAISEIKSSISKHAMIDRVRRFLPKIEPDKFTERGTAGIRSSVIDNRGKFVPDIILEESESSLHILNYNSPGATGALAFAAHIISKLQNSGYIPTTTNDHCGPWRFTEIMDQIEI